MITCGSTESGGSRTSQGALATSESFRQEVAYVANVPTTPRREFGLEIGSPNARGGEPAATGGGYKPHA